MNLIISKEKAGEYLNVSFHRKEKDFNRYIAKAQQFYLKNLLNEAFFSDLTNPSPQYDYSELIKGGAYVFSNGKKTEQTAYFWGLGACLAYFTYSEYLLEANHSDTAFGLKEKRYQEGDSISFAERRDLSKKYIQEAYSLWEDCKLYLIRKREKYPLFLPDASTEEKQTMRGFKISLI